MRSRRLLVAIRRCAEDTAPSPSISITLPYQLRYASGMLAICFPFRYSSRRVATVAFLQLVSQHKRLDAKRVDCVPI